MKSASFRKGFTLIEVILFLTISGLMLFGMMIGMSGSINRQRYDEVTSSLLDYLQSQYNLNDNIRNDRPNNLACDGSSTSEARGWSDCTIAGRIVYSADGKTIQSRPVYATSDGDPGLVADEAAYLDSLGLIAAPDVLAGENTSYTVMWQTKVYTDKGNQDIQNDFSVLILRLPTNGLTRTYVSESGYSGGNLNTLLASTLETLNLCVQPSGLTNTPAQGVRILSGASSSNGVQIIPARGDGSGACAA